MPDTLALWHAEHVNFARLLNLLDNQLALFHGGKSARLRADAEHHVLHDALFRRSASPEGRPGLRQDPRARQKRRRTVDELATQHALLHKRGQDLVRHLDDIVNDTISSREAVEAGRARIRRHAAQPHADRGVRNPAAGRLAAHARTGRRSTPRSQHIEDPLFGKHPEARYVALHRQIARQAAPAGDD